MIDIAVYNMDGKKVDSLEVDEQLLGGEVNPALLKQAIVMYHANKRQGTCATRSRGMVAGSTRKLYRQKGTGNARMGTVRTVIRKGGGVAFAKKPRDFRQKMPRKQRRIARNNAVLAKLQAEDAVIVDQLSFDAPKTSRFANMLASLNIDRSCLVATEGYDTNVYKSSRNIPRIDVIHVNQLNAGDICARRKLLFTRAAFETLLNPETASPQQPGQTETA